jgi:hypothetical protein
MAQPCGRVPVRTLAFVRSEPSGAFGPVRSVPEPSPSRSGACAFGAGTVAEPFGACVFGAGTVAEPFGACAFGAGTVAE